MHLSRRAILRFIAFWAFLAEMGTLSVAAAQVAEKPGTLAVLHRFVIDGGHPNGELAVGSDGHLYGVTYSSGGNHSVGTIFRISLQGEFRTIARLDGGKDEREGKYLGHCYAGLTPSRDGWMYGTTYSSSPGGGAFFRVSPQGEVQEYFRFTRKEGPHLGDGPWAELVEAADGWFYGTTCNGGRLGTHGGGTVFRVSREGRHDVLFEFDQDNPAEFGTQPKGRLTRGPDGALYGVSGGRNVFRVAPPETVTKFATFPNHIGRTMDRLLLADDGNFYGTADGRETKDFHGCVVRMSPTGEVTRVINFTGRGGAAPGADPRCGLTQGPDGALYGMTYAGGALDRGTIFRVTLDGAFAALAHFTGKEGPCPGAGASHGLIVGPDGALYGNTTSGGASDKGTIFRVTTTGDFTTLASFGFADVQGNGAMPEHGVVRGGDGNYYGTTTQGGRHDRGTIFRLSAEARLVTLLHFEGKGENGNRGARPSSPLVISPDGESFIGATSDGGRFNQGTLFRLHREGEMRTFADFDGWNGARPHGALVIEKDGTIFGTTASMWGNEDRGTVFRFRESERERGPAVLIRFTGKGAFPGANPMGGLVEGRDGALYGTTLAGGDDDLGTVFRVTKEGEFRSLHSFRRGEVATLGVGPRSTLVVAQDGQIYGTTQGGEGLGPGAVFRMTPQGKVEPVGQFRALGRTAGNPRGGLTLGKDGTIFGLAFGSLPDHGGIFKISPVGGLSMAHNFNGEDGASPSGTLWLDADGSLVGTTTTFDPDQGGTIFRFTP